MRLICNYSCTFFRQPEFCDWAFNLERGQKCLEKWNLIPNDVDILITHTPPVGHGDLCCTGVRAGCVELLNSIQKRIKPKYHVFGHIHEGMFSMYSKNAKYVKSLLGSYPAYCPNEIR